MVDKVPLIETPGERRVPVVSVLLPSRGINVSEFTFDIGQMLIVTTLEQRKAGQFDFEVKRKGGTYIDINRCELMKAALYNKDGSATDVTHILWVDDDMTFPPDALLHLLSLNVPFVGANYSRRKFPLEPVAIKTIEPGKKLYTTDESTGLEQVEALGFGLCMIRRDVVDAIEFPWCETHYDRVKKRWVGEDVDFCQKAATAGFPPFVDHDLSKQVTHMGNMAFTLEHANKYLETRNQLLDLAGSAE